MARMSELLRPNWEDVKDTPEVVAALEKGSKTFEQ
jgi:hypothetical protein